MKCENCLLVFKNKKINDLSGVSDLTGFFASRDIYFRRVVMSDYGDSGELTSVLNECKGKFNQIVVYCPAGMAEGVKNYTQQLFGGLFDNFGVLKRDTECVYMLYSDGDGKLTPDDVASMINSAMGETFGRSYVKTVGASSKLVGDVVAAAKNICPDCDFNVSEKFSDCTIEIVYPQTVYKSQYDNMYRSLLNGLNGYIYALENITLEEQLFRLLQLRRMKISVSESFTGGGVAKRLVSVPGISEVYDEGLNTYSNRSKSDRLGVKDITLKQFGAVSKETAVEMAEGLVKAGNCDVALSTTGIAGPKSDMTAKPVGLLYIGLATADRSCAFGYNLKGSRQTITETAINLALFHVYTILK